MGSYTVEFLDTIEREPCLLGRYPTRPEAAEVLRAEWNRWQTLDARNEIHVAVSRLDDDQFVLRWPSGAGILYRVKAT